MDKKELNRIEGIMARSKAIADTDFLRDNYTKKNGKRRCKWCGKEAHFRGCASGLTQEQYKKRFCLCIDHRCLRCGKTLSSTQKKSGMDYCSKCDAIWEKKLKEIDARMRPPVRFISEERERELERELILSLNKLGVINFKSTSQRERAKVRQYRKMLAQLDAVRDELLVGKSVKCQRCGSQFVPRPKFKGKSPLTPIFSIIANYSNCERLDSVCRPCELALWNLLYAYVNNKHVKQFSEGLHCAKCGKALPTPCMHDPKKIKCFRCRVKEVETQRKRFR